MYVTTRVPPDTVLPEYLTHQVITDKCTSCTTAGYVRDPDTFQCRDSSCTWPGSFPANHTNATLSATQDIPVAAGNVLVPGQTVNIMCANNTHNVGSSPSATAHVSCGGVGLLVWPAPDLFQCVETHCGCPGSGAVVSGAGCPKVESDSSETWTCVSGCHTGWSGATCETPAACTTVPTVAYPKAWIHGTCGPAPVVHLHACPLVCASGYHLAHSSNSTGNQSTDIVCNAGTMSIPTNLTCETNICPCPGHGDEVTGTNCTVHGNVCVNG